MKNSIIRACILALGSFAAASGVSATRGIGTVQSPGAFRLDEATVINNGTLFEGSVVETTESASAVVLNSGSRFTISKGSRGRIFGDRLLLEKGSTAIENLVAFKLVAQGLTIQPDRSITSGSIVQSKPGRLQIQSGVAALRVLNSSGQLIANMSPGSALAFEPQQLHSATRITGCLQEKAGRYVLTDEVTNIAVEVAGTNASKESGNRVEITGNIDASTSRGENVQLIQPREIRRLSQGCDTATAAAATNGSKRVKLGMGAAKGTIAIIGGIAVAGVVGGLAASDTLPGGSSSASSR